MKSNSLIRLGLCVLCLQFFALKPVDAQRKIDNLYYNIDVQKGTAKVTRYANSDYGMNKNYVSGDLIIPASINDNGNIYKVVEIENWAFTGCSGLTSVTILGEDISIGVDAFANCTSLGVVNIAGTVSELGESAFYNTAWESNQNDGIVILGNCIVEYKGQVPNDSHVVIDEGVVSIANGAFRNSTGITSLSFPSTLRHIGQEAFYGCSSIKSIAIPASVESIGADAFSYCSGMISAIVLCDFISCGLFEWCENLSDVQVSPSLVAIEDGAFVGCTALQSFTIPETVVNIGHNAFMNTGLTSISIPASVKSWGENVFRHCEHLSTAVINCHNIAHGMFSGSALKSISISDETETIGTSSFQGCNNLSSVSIPSSVRRIEESAFYGCSNLEYVSIGGETLNTIGGAAFSDCTGLKLINIPKSVTSIGNFAFHNCRSFERIELPYSVMDIGDLAFYNCYAVDEIIFNPAARIGSKAFENTGWWNSREDGVLYLGKSVVGYKGYAPDGSHIKIKEGTINISPKAFYNLSMDSVTIPQSVIFIGEGAFSYCQNLSYVDFNASVDSISSGLFFCCTKLEKINIPYSVKKICKGAFSGSMLKTVSLPTSLISIDREAFAGCSNITSISIPDNVNSLGSEAFSGCSNITAIKIPASVIEIGQNVFQGCSSLSSVDIRNSQISYGEFAGTGLKSVKIPNSVSRIGAYAFSGCSELTSITIPNNVTSINEYAFYYCTSLSTIILPSTIEYVGMGAIDGTAWYNAHEDGLVYFADMAYTYKGALPKNTDIVIKEGTKGIVDNAFYERSGLTSVTIPNSVCTIGESSFYGCKALTSVTIGSSITSIGQNAFNNCVGLKTFSIACEKPFVIEENVFMNETIGWDCYAIYKRATLCVPKGTMSAYLSKEGWNCFSNIEEFDVPVITGDANGDGVVDVADVVAIVNYILNKPGENFNEKATDVNGDGVIDVADVVAVVNIILKGGNANSPEAKAHARAYLKAHGFIVP